MARRRAAVWAAATALAALAAGAEEPEAKPWSASIEATAAARYVWRGLELTDEPVLQPAATFAWRGLALNVWGNMDLTDANGNDGEFNELDLTAEYSGSWGRVGYSLGAIRYHFPNTDFAGTTELAAGLGLDLPLAPRLTAYRDVDEGDGWYVQLAAGHAFERLFALGEGVEVGAKLAASVAWADADYNAFYFGADASGLVDATASIGLPIALGRGLTVSPSVSYSKLLDGDVQDRVDEDSLWWTALKVSFAF